MRVVLFYILLCFAFLARGQNLVNNPSFEEYNQCPDSVNWHIYNVNNWNVYANDDYLAQYNNICNLSITQPRPGGVPFSTLGGGSFQYPESGDGYIGLELIKFTNYIYRSIPQIRLTKPLDSGQLYCYTMYVSLCDSCGRATDDLSVLFTDNPINLNITDTFPTPQIVHHGTFLTDKINWMKYEGTFIAQGGEEYMLIGCFSKHEDLDMEVLDSNLTVNAYYLIDDVSLLECDQVGLNESPISPITIYPNPSNGIFTVENTKPIKHLKIYSSYGQLVLTESPNSVKTTVDLTHLPAGIYLCNINGYSIKLIKE